MQLRTPSASERGRSSLGVLVGVPARRRRRWPWALCAIAALVAAALAFAFFAWPRGGLAIGSRGLPSIRSPIFGGTVEHVVVRDAEGTVVPVRLLRDGTLWPRRRIAPGTKLFTEVVFRRPGWAGWIAGHSQTVRLELTAPQAHVRSRWLRVTPGAAVQVRFDRPVREVEVTGLGRPQLRHLRHPARVVRLDRLAREGSVRVAGVARNWERLPPAAEVTWFPPSTTPMALVSPKPGGRLEPLATLRLRFSEPVRTLLHGRMPSLKPAVGGRWRMPDARTLVFTPSGYGFGLQGYVQVKLSVPVQRPGVGKPTKTMAWKTPAGSELRLQQLLGQLGYLPLTWTPAHDPPSTIGRQLAAAVHPPDGSFRWRYPRTPASLVRRWQEGSDNDIVRGALMAFEDTHDLPVDALAGHDVWQALIADAVAGRRRVGGYSYVFVHTDVPQSLNLWHNGRVILTSPGNTGVPAAPTELGTFTVFEHIPVGTMSGTNPDGTHYYDPGIRWISYFNRGDAIHAFNRASFGTPQSLGCVELPLASAAKVWPYTPIGTLVTIQH